jgi:hypothetical protein
MVHRLPWLLRLLDPTDRACELARRLHLASWLLDISPAACRRLYDGEERGFLRAGAALVATLMLQVAIAPLRVLFSRLWRT